MAKQVGNYIISYLRNDEIAIAYKGALNGISSKVRITDKMEGVLKHVDTNHSIIYEGSWYPTLCFKNTIPRKVLEAYLQVEP